MLLAFHLWPLAQTHDNQKKAESQSRQRRRARRSAERQAAAEEAPPVKEAAKAYDLQDTTHKEHYEESEVIETVDNEDMSKKAKRHENENEFVENDIDSKAEEADVKIPLKVDIQVQTDDESFKDIYVEHKEALEKIKLLEERVKLYGATIRKFRVNSKNSCSTSDRGAAGRS